jgi:hypothetical protein
MGLILSYLHLSCCGHIQRMSLHSSEIQKRTSLLQITGLLELAKWTDWSSWGLEPKTNSKKNLIVAFIMRLVCCEHNGNMTECKTAKKNKALSCCNIMFGSLPQCVYVVFPLFRLIYHKDRGSTLIWITSQKTWIFSILCILYNSHYKCWSFP